MAHDVTPEQMAVYRAGLKRLRQLRADRLAQRRARAWETAPPHMTAAILLEGVDL